ncbi:MAG: 3,4-dihydroxy-2-butanone-4-phosphate synthase [Candidatus Methanomethylophilaceae archaeon]|nr:3,4-dihydroxy-2-butanone-4-phosphate synthase [Candidatus Methanomethylophilaceae archaeon]
MSIERALQDIRDGKIVLVFDFDDREKETDMTLASEFVDTAKVRTLRKDAGGLLCTTTPYAIAKEVGLPFLSDTFWDCSEKYPLLKAMAPTDIPYDNTKSSFGITINHRNTYTGITDSDRALTIKTYSDVLFSGKPTEEIQ